MKQWDLITGAASGESVEYVEPLKCQLIGTGLDRSVLAVDRTRLNLSGKKNGSAPKLEAVFVMEDGGPTIEEESRTQIISAFMRLLIKLNYTSRPGS